MSLSRHGRRSYNVVPSRLAPQPRACRQLPRHTPTNMTTNTTSAVRQRPRNFHARAASNACAIGVAGKLSTSCHQHLRRSAARIRRVSCSVHRTAYAGPSGEEHCVGTGSVCRDNRAYSWDWEWDSSKPYLLCIVPTSAVAFNNATTHISTCFLLPTLHIRLTVHNAALSSSSNRNEARDQHPHLARRTRLPSSHLPPHLALTVQSHHRQPRLARQRYEQINPSRSIMYW